MGKYEKLDSQGNPKGRLSRSDMPVEGGGSRYVQDTPTFESLVANAGQGTRGDRTYKIGAQEYDRSKKRPSDTPPAAIREELDAMKQEKANEAGMKSHEGRRLAKGGMAKGYASGGSVRGGGCEQRGKTKGKMV